jgi:hypothetical protein
VQALDALNASAMTHTEIARHVHERFGVPGWWSQSVAVGYERIRGLREKGQSRGGTYEVSKSKTVPVAIADLWAAFAPAARRRWLGDVALTVRKATPEKTMRVTWPDGTSVELFFWKKGAAKSQISLAHRKLATRADAEKARAFWGERLSALVDWLG